ncbi:hypothetical protein BN7_5994 [Wickerhamomyces ciferrii]|uniref:Uncharacterized protein n=1 Tax=Wickerhamomyces ciferrii (strain ATCC 14091 / BCRC 22168 / CBS 111 / JCM 3599 / NBRC 0793 / NRRL Y-1031 F-60-10) TaxID=1206466 RepID=K0KTB2_WICCF|nr:uncharacterized protein BN7_5994 [Wickerhamomyces ciferrii]CCH46401.1 hypothetical protein BN7_5994 [Wickerhamomyces ciferrii]
MSLDPNNHQNAVSAAANALQAVGIAQTNNPHHQQQQQQAAQQYAQQLQHNQYYQQVQAQQQAQRASQQAVSQHQQLLNAANQLQQAQAQQAQHQQQYQSAQQQLAQHLPQATSNSNQNQNNQGLIVPTQGQGFQPTQPQSEFGSRHDLISYIHSYARENGFGIVISHSNEKAIYFTCELGGSYRNKRNINDKERKRKLTTRKINCPFTMVANCKKNDNDEVVKWVLRITNADHNHDKMNLNESFPMLRRRNPEINRQIRELYMKGNKPLVIEKLLKSHFKDILINREDIYNETRKMKREERLKNSQGLPLQQPQIQQHQQQVQQQAQQLQNQIVQDQSQQVQQQTAQQLKDEANSFEQNIPSLLQGQGLPLGLTNQYLPNLQQQTQPNPNQQNNQYQYNLHQQAAAAINAQNVGQALAQQPKDDNLSNIDISLVKQQGL